MIYKKELSELRKRLIYCLISFLIMSAAAYYFFTPILNFMIRPLNSIPHSLIATAVFDGFTVKLTLALITGLVCALPVFLYHLCRFLLPAMRKKEKTILISTLLASLFLGVAGFSFSYFLIIPTALKCIVNPHFIPSGITILLSYRQTVILLCKLLAGGILIAELPLILILLIYLKLLPLSVLTKYSRHIIVAIFILAALLTPPDAVSQLLVAIPLCGLFGLSMLLAKLLPRIEKKKLKC